MDECPKTAEEREKMIVSREAKWRSLVMFLAVLVVFCCVVVIVQYRQSRIQRDQLLDLSQDNANIIKQIESCTLPSGECYKRGNENRTAFFIYMQNILNTNTAICERQNDIALQRGISLETSCPKITPPAGVSTP